MSITVRYPTLLGTAIVATVFSLIVGALMALDFVQRGQYELFDTPEFLALKAQLHEQPGNAELQEQIRELDLQLRDTYFRNRRFMAVGMYLLIGGVALALITARWAVSVRGATYQPAPVDPAVDVESRVQRNARWAAVGLVMIMVAVLCGFAIFTEPVGQHGTAQRPPTLAAASPGPAPTDSGDAEQAARTPPASPTEAGQPAEPAAALPSYDEYLQQWPRFRGPTGSGVSRFTDVPTQWSVPDNAGILWKTAVPLPGANSPVVWGRHVLVSGATADEQAVFCYDAASGRQLWRHDLTPTRPADGKELEVMEATGYAAPTMATDGLRAYAIFATGDVVAVSLEGQELWHRNLGIPKNHYGHASSLATYNDLLIIQLDQGQASDGLSRLLALHGATGAVAWEVKREVPCSWASPIVVQHDDRWMVITCVNPWVIAYSPADGSELWRAKCLGGEVGPSPVCVDGVAYVANESSDTAAVRVDGSGDVTGTHILWTTDIDVPDVVSPLVTDQYVLLTVHGVLAAFERAAGDAAADGEPREPLWEEDLSAEVYSSPSQVGDLVYLFSDEGKAWIVRPAADACQRVGELEMGEPVRTSPAFQPGRIYIRGEEHLFCIGAQ